MMQTRPQMVPDGGIWAPDINLIDGKYVLYYSKSTWGGEWECGIGVATADTPRGLSPTWASCSSPAR